MKQGKLFLSVIGIALLLLPFVTALNASAYDLQVSQDKEGIYWGTSPEGVQIGCCIEEFSEWDNETESYKYSYSAYIQRFKDATGKTVTLPGSVTVKKSNNSYLIDENIVVTSLGSHSEWSNVSFDNTSMCNLIIPAHYTYIKLHSPMCNVVLKDNTPPIITYKESLSSVRCIVPAESYEKYREACGYNNDGWTNDILVIPNNYGDIIHKVTVTEAGTLEDLLWDLLNSKKECLDDVYNLEVNGNINGRDLNVLAKLKNLTTLDLSATGIESMRDCTYRSFLETVKLPNTVKTIEASAFLCCYNLKTINIDNVEYIGSSAFSNAYSLESITGRRVSYIGDSAFSGCCQLKTIDFPNVTQINYGAFQYTGLKAFHIYDNVYYGSSCLNHSQVEKMYFHTNMNFNDVRYLPYLTDVYLYDPFPGDIIRDDTQDVIPRLHVPGFSFESYIDHPNYYGFDKVLKLDDNLTSLNVYKDLNIHSNESLAKKFDITIKSNYDPVSLENNAKDALSVGDFVQYYKLGSYWYGDKYADAPSTTFINNGTITADNVKVVMDMNGGWNFISFPYDVNIEDITTPNEALWVIREYDGDIRAKRTDTGDNSQTESAWINTTTPTLKAGKGYIFHFSSNNGSEFTFPAIENENKNNLFSNEDVTIPLAYHSSTYPHNASWNLIGNPFDACFDIREIDSKVPVITVWRGNTYEAFSIVEDDYVLAPFEAFFVQATGENTNLTFLKEGRQHSFYEKKNQHHAPRRMVAANNDRAIINLHIEGNGFYDRTRLVINEDASTDYEIGFDASKFLSPDVSVPQIFMVQDGQKLSINERPLGTGMFRVGTSFSVEGTYTISCDTKNSAYSVILYDAETGVETDITESTYEFLADAGRDNNRFSVRLKIGESGVNDVKADNFNVTLNGGNLSVAAEGEINVFSIDGKLVASGNDNLEISLSKGIYVVKAAGQTKKVTY